MQMKFLLIPGYLWCMVTYPAMISLHTDCEVMKCGCVKSFCSGHCSCKNNNLPCTELCACEADPDHCANNADENVADSNLSDTEV